MNLPPRSVPQKIPYKPNQPHPHLPREIPCRLFHPLIMLWVVQNYPHTTPKAGPTTLSTNENPRILKSHSLMAYVALRLVTQPSGSVALRCVASSLTLLRDWTSRMSRLLLRKQRIVESSLFSTNHQDFVVDF